MATVTTGWDFTDKIVGEALYESTFEQMKFESQKTQEFCAMLEEGLKQKKPWNREYQKQAQETIREAIKTHIEIRNTIIHEPDNSIMWATAGRSEWLERVDEAVRSLQKADELLRK